VEDGTGAPLARMPVPVPRKLVSTGQLLIWGLSRVHFPVRSWERSEGSLSVRALGRRNSDPQPQATSDFDTPDPQDRITAGRHAPTSAPKRGLRASLWIGTGGPDHPDCARRGLGWLTRRFLNTSQQGQHRTTAIGASSFHGITSLVPQEVVKCTTRIVSAFGLTWCVPNQTSCAPFGSCQDQSARPSLC